MNIKLPITLIFSVMLILVSLSTVVACDPVLTFTVENQTDQILTMSVDGYQYSKVIPHAVSKVIATNTIISPQFFVEAVNESGEIIYSQAFGWRYMPNEPLRNLLPRNGIIIITPTEAHPYLPLEIVNLTTHKLYISTVAQIAVLEPGQSMNKRPLPSNIDTYTITAVAYDIKVNPDQDPRRTSAYGIIYQHQFNRTELERQNWKITITESN